MLGFLSPFGEFVQCNQFEHIKLADTILKEVYKQERNNPVDQLCKYGWIVIQDFFVGFAGDEMYHTPRITEEQMKWLEDNIKTFSYSQIIGLNLLFEINEILYEVK